MPVLLPPESVPGSSNEDGNAATPLPFLSDEDILPLLRTALHAKRGFGISPPTSFGQLFIDLLTRKQPTLLERTRRFAGDAASHTLVGHLCVPNDGRETRREGGNDMSQRRQHRFLYIMQHEWAVVAPGEGIDYIASDEATTCHLVGLRERGSGVVGLAHVDSPEAVEDLSAMEAAVEEKARALRGGGGAAGSDVPLTFDLFIVGGYDGDSEAGLLTAVVLRHFASESPRRYHLQLALISSLNTCAHPFPSSSSSSSSSFSLSVSAPTCRSLGFMIGGGGGGGGEGGRDGRETPDSPTGCGRVFTGDVPKGLRGPKHTLRALRLWGWGPRNLIQVEVKYQNQKEIETEAGASLPQHYNLRAAKKPSDVSKEDSSSSTSSSSSSSSSSSTTAPSAAVAAAGGGEGGENEVIISIIPFRFKPSKKIHALSLLSDENLIRETSTSPAIESPSFVKDIRAVLNLLSTAKPEDFFGPSVTQALVVPLPRVDIVRVVEEEREGEGESR